MLRYSVRRWADPDLIVAPRVPARIRRAMAKRDREATTKDEKEGAPPVLIQARLAAERKEPDKLVWNNLADQMLHSRGDLAPRYDYS